MGKLYKIVRVEEKKSVSFAIGYLIGVGITVFIWAVGAVTTVNWIIERIRK